MGAEMAADQITAQVVREYLESVSTEMSRIMERTAVHPLFSECHDYSTGVFYYGSGEVTLMARATAIPVHIFASVLSVEALLAFFRDDLHEGDVVILNDPYFGGTHSADWTVMKPIFLSTGGMLFPSVRAHMADSGGPLPANYNPLARDVWQEAFRISPIKIVERGRIREDVRELLLANTRIPEVLEGDLRAMIAACDVAEERIKQLLRKYGEAVVESSVAIALDYAERRFRAEIASWPDGEYVGVAHLDHDSAGNHDIEVRTTLVVDGSSLHFDFSGSSPQSPGFINSPFGNTASWAYTALCAVISEDIPINSGIFRAVTMYAPEGTIVNPLPPSPVMATTGRIGSEIGVSVMKALEQIVPEAAGNVGFGGTLCTTYGWDDRYEEFFVTIEYGSNLTSASAAKGTDGWGGWPAPFSTLVFNNIEMLEIQFPFLYHQYEYTTDTAAPGEWRGVPAFAMKREARSEQYVNSLVVGVRHRTPGWVGGAEGIPNRIVLDYGGPEERPVEEAVTRVRIPPGHFIASLKSGGGGWGDPFARDPARVRDDVLDEIYTVGFVEREFGVVIDPATMEVDAAATAERRARARAPRQRVSA